MTASEVFCRVGGKRGAGISSNLPDKDFPLRWYYEDSPFLTAPPRTVLAAFTAHGSPVSSGLPVRLRRISRHSLVYPLYSLPPLAMYQAFPGSDYCGGSVAMGLSTFRRSRIPIDETFSALRACLSSNPLIGGHSPQRALRDREQELRIEVSPAPRMTPFPGMLRWMEVCIVSDIGSAFASPQVQSSTSPYAQDWRILLPSIPSGFSASGHATVP